MTEDRNGARLTGAPISLHFVPGGMQNCIIKARYIENSLNANGVIIVEPLRCAINIYLIRIH